MCPCCRPASRRTCDSAVSVHTLEAARPPPPPPYPGGGQTFGTVTVRGLRPLSCRVTAVSFGHARGQRHQEERVHKAIGGERETEREREGGPPRDTSLSEVVAN